MVAVERHPKFDQLLSPSSKAANIINNNNNNHNRMTNNSNQTDRLAMTAPIPRIKRMGSDCFNDAASTSSESSLEERGISTSATINIRRNLFSPRPLLSMKDQENVIPTNEMQVTYNAQGALMKTASGESPSKSGVIHSAKKRVLRGTPMKTPKRTGNPECGLTFEIKRELNDTRRFPLGNDTAGAAVGKAFMTPSKVHPKHRELIGTPSDGNKTSRFDLLPRVPQTDSKVMRISKTASFSSDSTNKNKPETANSNKPDGEKPTTTSTSNSSYAFGTPIRKGRKKNPSLTFSALSSKKKLKKALTPPREGFGSHIKARMKPNSGSAAGGSPMTLGTSFLGVEDYRLTSSELEPSEFQLELPSKREMIVHGKICNLIDGYTAVHRNFNFAVLAGVSRGTLEKEYERSTADKPMIAGSAHRDVVAKILDCCDDLVVEGFIREYGGEENGGSGTHKDRVEACIFSSETLRQLIVCYRGSTANQAKPLKSNFFGKEESSSMLHEDQQVRVLSSFREAYFATSMEETVFALLENLASRKPFFDVVMTGHSFGAAMATIGAVRYATSQPMIRVSCHVFGVPRLGGEEWRQMVHSVPNLKVFRAENQFDPFIALPSGSDWIHVGHGISFGEGADYGVEFNVRQFDRDRSSNGNTMFRVPKVSLAVNPLLAHSKDGKHDHEIKTYADKLISSGDKWFSEFSGFKGSGVNGANNEKRTIS
mmetsp:Transcript_15635/g.33301  ORF Transcript_15635/g.33301 Transcript_15635/m.33301 type:complete len:711 (-) Transcript_15635:212-2344(-)